MAKKRYPSAGRTTKKRYKLSGGPLHGHIVYLSCRGTLPFSMKGMTGRYNDNNQWEPA